MITTTKLTDRFYLFQNELDCFAQLIIGENRALLFDTMCGIDDLKSAVEAVTHSPFIIIASHGHFDHIGGSRQFDTVYLSEKDHRILKDYDEELLNKWIKEMYPEQAEEIHFGCDGWKNIKALSFQTIDLGNLICEIIPLPGHSEGSVGVLIPEWKVLLSGDALSPVMSLNFQNHCTKKTQLETLHRVKSLEFDYYLTSHSSKKMPKALIDRMIRCIENSKGKRHHPYQYPKPPYSKGYFYLDSIEDEPVGIIVGEKDDML